MTDSTADSHHLTLRVDPTPHALARITAICARRRLEVVELDYRLGSGGVAVVDLAITGPAPERAQAWLGRLVEVLSVELRPAPGPRRRTRARTRRAFALR
ncbi:MAG TPA: hypothetical protein VGF25_18775 [Thermoleophilaceae bacterium]|jgi:hypothetical protein